MTPWEQFKHAVVGRQVQITRREHDWVFDFGDNHSIVIETIWRLMDSSGIRLTSEDDGQQFGLPAPVNAEKKANELLRSATVVSIDDLAIVPDFVVRLSDGLAVDVLARSSGYESWQAYFGEAIIVGRCD